MSQHFDLIAIGGGSGGLAVAEKAAQLGRCVALVETGRLGGTCVNQGCVPKKVMWYAAQLAEAVSDAPDFGVRARSDGLDWQQLVAGRNGYVANINDYWDGYAERTGITRITGQARFVDARTIAVGDEHYSPSCRACPVPNSVSIQTVSSSWRHSRSVSPSLAAAMSGSNWRAC